MFAGSHCFLEFFPQRGEAKLLTEEWEGAVADLKLAAEKSPQVQFARVLLFYCIMNEL